MRRLVLAEFVYPDKFENFRSDMFPFYMGAAESLGLEVLWLRVPLDESDRRPDNRFVVSPGRAKTAALCERLRAFSPGLMVSNEKLDEETTALLRGAAPGCRLEDACGEGRHRDISWFLGLLGREEAPRAAFELPEPRYEPRWLLEPGGPRLIKVLAGSECLYRRPLADNPYFEGVDLSEARSRGGCSFCAAAGFEVDRLPLPAVELAMRQIDAAMRSKSLAGTRKSFMICGIQVFHALPDFFAALERRGHPGADFFFSARADEFLAKADVIEAELPRWRERGHALNLWNMGAENLSPAENLRFNKGISAEQIEEALGRLDRLEAAFPETFFFRKHGGLGMIIFTPWTTLEDLRVNIRAARRLKLAGSLFFNSRLQLLPGLPLTLLARKDGLLADSFPDRPYDSGCISDWDQGEVPWRFRDAAVAAAYRVSMRLEPIEALSEGDPVAAGVARMVELARAAGAKDSLDVLEAVVERLAQRAK